MTEPRGRTIFGKKQKEKKYTSIFFVTDIHGSDRTFRKLLTAGKYYEADVVLMCGDITGKMLVPIVKGADGVYRSRLFGQAHDANTEAELVKLEETISNAGYYPYRTDDATFKKMQADPALVDEIFKRLMLERLERWMKMAEQHYRDTGIKCMMSGGNDDIYETDSVLNSSQFVTSCEHKVVKLDDDHEMITVGEVNTTPWKCPRDVTEEELKRIIDGLAAKVGRVENSVFNLHAPPKDATIDTAFQLDTSVDPPKIVTQGGQPMTTGVGSAAVREVIEKYKPLLALHGHIHEARGVVNLGRTLCINPGSEYGEGILRGAIVNLSKDKVLSYQLTSG